MCPRFPKSKEWEFAGDDMSDKKELDWRGISFEVIAIVFAVLLALWLEGLREDAERHERAQDFLARIQSEIQQNYTELSDAIVENEEQIAGLSAALNENDLALERIGPFLQISGGSTVSSAWQSAQMTRAIGAMPIETVAQLAVIYDTQAYYANNLQSLFDHFADLVVASQNEATQREAVMRMILRLQVLNNFAQQTVRRYERFLDVPEGE